MIFIRYFSFVAIFSFPLFAWSSLPVIDVWYGPNQDFGQIGQPQEWVNILGKVTDPDGISSLTYTLNGGAELPLSVGPDSRRLWNRGDFNVEIAYRDLQVGANTVVIAARDALGNQASETVTVNYAGVNVWPQCESEAGSWEQVVDEVFKVSEVKEVWVLHLDLNLDVS